MPDIGPRKVAAVVVSSDDFGVRALLLRRRGVLSPSYDFPGGDLEDGEMPAPAMRRWLLHSGPIDPELVGELRWQWCQRYDLTPCGVGFVMTLRVRGAEALRLVSRDAGHSHALLWRDLAQVRQWAPHCPALALVLLVAAISGPALWATHSLPLIDETDIWPVRPEDGAHHWGGTHGGQNQDAHAG